MTWKRTTIPWDQCSPSRQKRLREAWRRGNLEYKLNPAQLRVYNAVLDSHAKASTAAERTFALDIGRRWGKSTVKFALAFRAIMRNPERRVPYGAATKELVKDILKEVVPPLLADCPPELRPRWMPSIKTWVFPNRAELQIVGCDRDPDLMRGGATVAWFLDEAGFIRRLDYVLESIIRPMMLTEPDAFGVMGSTPPESPAHYWSQQVIPEHKGRGFYAHQTIEDNPMLEPSVRDAFIAKAGGRQSTRCRREYFAEHVVERTKAVVPEWIDVKDECVEARERPPFFDAYASADPGFVDLWHALFGYYDFAAAVLVIEREVVVTRAPTSKLAELLREAESHFGQPVYRRFSDTALQQICDLSEDHGLDFEPTAKDDKRAAINRMRLWVQQKRIRINPRCKHLLAQLEFGIWNDRDTDYQRTKDDPESDGPSMGHLDGIDALIYLVRNVEERRNPYPALPAYVQGATHHILPLEPDPEIAAVADMFGRGRRARAAR